MSSTGKPRFKSACFTSPRASSVRTKAPSGSRPTSHSASTSAFARSESSAASDDSRTSRPSRRTSRSSPKRRSTSATSWMTFGGGGSRPIRCRNSSTCSAVTPTAAAFQSESGVMR